MISILGTNRIYPRRIDSGDNICTTPIGISNALNSHFTRTGTRLVSNTPQSNVCFEDYIKPADCSFVVRETHCGVVRNLISSLQINRATGLDSISVRLFKEAGPVIIPSLSHVINLSIVSGYFPDNWKISKILSLYKEEVLT